MSALLAQGQRVLVTSARDQLLTVLRDKLPPGIRGLCVLLLSSTRPDGDGELELRPLLAAYRVVMAHEAPRSAARHRARAVSEACR
ncbi:hypothetical protein [Streptomyces sp. NPDC020681]|uniref:hypothetical protein n=1 Tax=Streptomyces sp. NPDC020681 TaxID=3365083 RepID=UPI0037933EE2